MEILSGEGRAFCVSADIKWVKSPTAEGFQDSLYPRLLTLTKPLIEAIHGRCNGDGLDEVNSILPNTHQIQSEGV